MPKNKPTLDEVTKGIKHLEIKDKSKDLDRSPKRKPQPKNTDVNMLDLMDIENNIRVRLNFDDVTPKDKSFAKRDRSPKRMERRNFQDFSNSKMEINL